MNKPFKLFPSTITLVVLVTFVLSACEKTIILDAGQSSAKIVIEAVVTDHIGYQFVKVSRSNGFYDAGHTPRINNAIVTVTDDEGIITVFNHNPGGNPDSIGYYRPSPEFVGVAGKTYSLKVTVNGVDYEAKETLPTVGMLDSLKYQINDDQEEDPEVAGRFYELLMFATEPQETKDYYLFKFFRNDSLTVFNPSDIYFADDEILGEKIDGVQSPVYYAVDDTARVEMYSLTRSGYVFYNDLFNSLNNDGGIYGPPPANTRNNLSNGALGFFQVSSVSILGIRIE